LTSKHTDVEAVIPAVTHRIIPALPFSIIEGKFEGIVYNVNQQESIFNAKLFDHKQPNNEPLISEFSFNDISEQDKDYVKKGSSFFWYFTIKTEISGTIKREESIFFNRVKTINISNLEKKSDIADQMHQEIIDGQ